jgi:hypothetical protein
LTLVHLNGHATPEQGKILEKGILKRWKEGKRKNGNQLMAIWLIAHENKVRANRELLWLISF